MNTEHEHNNHQNLLNLADSAFWHCQFSTSLCHKPHTQQLKGGIYRVYTSMSTLYSYSDLYYSFFVHRMKIGGQMQNKYILLKY